MDMEMVTVTVVTVLVLSLMSFDGGNDDACFMVVVIMVNGDDDGDEQRWPRPMTPSALPAQKHAEIRLEVRRLKCVLLDDGCGHDRDRVGPQPSRGRVAQPMALQQLLEHNHQRGKRRMQRTKPLDEARVLDASVRLGLGLWRYAAATHPPRDQASPVIGSSSPTPSAPSISALLAWGAHCHGRRSIGGRTACAPQPETDVHGSEAAPVE